MKVGSLKRSQKTGLPPGSLVHIGERKNEDVKITLVEYNSEHIREEKSVSVDNCNLPFDSKTVTWIDVEGLHDVGLFEKLGLKFGIHPLIMEDILNTDQRPKIENHGSYLYIVLRVIGNDSFSEQVSIILGPNYIISFQEKPLNIFDQIRRRLDSGNYNIRKMRADFLAYSLIDVIVDSFFAVLEKCGDEIEILEDEIVKNPARSTLSKIHKLKRDMLSIRRSVWPLRELIGGLEKSSTELVGESMRVYLRDIYDHVAYLIDTIETFRDMLSGILDIYLSSINNRMNEIMKVLTIIATLFMPLSFIVGIYGMNFHYMPELGWRYGYPALWVVMVGVALSMLAYFRRKKWL